MSNKLTSGDFLKRYELHHWQDLWESIELHTAECVAEAVAEVKKTHFEIGGKVEISSRLGWEPAIIRATGLNGDYSTHPEDVRRPPSTQKMTDVELYTAVINVACKDLKLSRPTLEAMAKDLGVSIEVEVGDE